MKRITQRQASRIDQPGLYRADPTLYLCVAPGGSKSWVQRLSINGVRRDIGLGGFPVVSLANARLLAMKNRTDLAMGYRNPVIDRRALSVERRRRATMPTFSELDKVVVTAKAAAWNNGKTARNWRQRMDKYAIPRIGHKAIDTIGREDVLKILTPIWTDRPAVAKKLRQYLKAVFDHATAHGHISVNPAGEVINGALPRQKATQAHFKALDYKRVPEVISHVESTEASIAVKLAFRFIVLTAARSGEVRGARWSEIEENTWKIPAERMKTNREHRVPLSSAAMQVLAEAEAIADGSDLIFPSPVRCGCQLSENTLTRVLQRTGYAELTTIHGFRSTFRDWCADAGKPRELAEAALAHVVGGVEGAYFRSDLYDRRRALMIAWSDHCTATKGKVVQIHG